MIRDAYEHDFDIIVVKSISRSSRNTVDLLETVSKLRILGVEVIFEQENISSSDIQNDLMIAVQSAFAQAESESISDNIKWGLRRGFETGRSKLYTRKCFGYKHNECSELVIDEEQADVVRQIFALYLKGYSIGMIINEMKIRKVKSPIGKDTWSKRAI